MPPTYAVGALGCELVDVGSDRVAYGDERRVGRRVVLEDGHSRSPSTASLGRAARRAPGRRRRPSPSAAANWSTAGLRRALAVREWSTIGVGWVAPAAKPPSSRVFVASADSTVLDEDGRAEVEGRVEAEREEREHGSAPPDATAYRTGCRPSEPPSRGEPGRLRGLLRHFLDGQKRALAEHRHEGREEGQGRHQGDGDGDGQRRADRPEDAERREHQRHERDEDRAAGGRDRLARPLEGVRDRRSRCSSPSRMRSR